MEEAKNKSTENDKSNQIPEIINKPEYKWFFDSFEKKKRNEIFEIIYDYLFKKEETREIEDYPKSLKDYIKTKDSKYYNKTNKEIYSSFKEKEVELNKRLEKFKIRLTIKDKYYLYIEDIEKNNLAKITCLRNVRFGNEYEWICSPHYLLYFQYGILNYKKPSRVLIIDIKNEGKEEEEKVDTVDTVTKANQILENENFIYIKDTGIQNIDYKKILEDGKKEFNFERENILEYLDYCNNDPKQIIDSNIIFDNNYEKVIDFSFEPKFDNLIYSFHNGYYFFEVNLIACLNSYIRGQYKFLYLNFNKINKIYNNKYKFKQYLTFWLAKLFPNQEEIDNKPKFYEFIQNLIDLIIKNKNNYLDKLLSKINEAIIIEDKIVYDNSYIFRKKILIILNNIDSYNFQLITKKIFRNINILFIFDIQANFDIFQSFYYEQTKLKKFFLENEDEIIYKDPPKDNIEKNYFSLFQSKHEYENSRKELIIKILNSFGNDNEILLNLVFICNISEFINRFNNKINSIIELKINLGMESDINILKPFCPLINLHVSSNENTNFNIDDIKFKESFIYDQLNTQYLSSMVHYLNYNSTELYLDDIKGPLLEKDIILSILTGKIKQDKYKIDYKFTEIKVQSLYCFNQNKLKNYEDNKDRNVIITQESKTSEFYDFAFKINNYMKFGQISSLKDEKDLEKLSRDAIILDFINFNRNKDKLNLGDVNSYSFALITFINTFNNYKDLDQEKKEKHTFFLMKEHCKKNHLEFYIYNYYENKIYIYNENSGQIEKFDNFFNVVNEIKFFDKNLQLYKFIESSNRKISFKLVQKDLLDPLKQYYYTIEKKLIRFIYLAKYEFNPSMLNMFSGINNIGFAFWNYSEKKQREYLQINLNNNIKYFKDNIMLKNKPAIFENTKNSDFHALLFLLQEEKIEKEVKIKEKDENIFLSKKRKIANKK